MGLKRIWVGFFAGVCLTLLSAAPVAAASSPSNGFGEYLRLSFDEELIDSIGIQKPSMCSAFSLAYARTILDNEAANPYSYWISGQGACWRAAGYESKVNPGREYILKNAYEELLEGRPSIVYVNGSYSENRDRNAYSGHYVAIVGYRALADSENLAPSDFLALDPSPWGPQKLFVINDNQFRGYTRFISTSGEGARLDYDALNERYDLTSLPCHYHLPWDG